MNKQYLFADFEQVVDSLNTSHFAYITVPSPTEKALVDWGLERPICQKKNMHTMHNDPYILQKQATLI